MRFTLIGDPASSPFEHARGIHALVLGWIASADQESAKELHDANQLKPLTIGPLIQLGAGGKHIFDVCLLSEWLEPLIRTGARNTDRVILGRSQYHLSTSVQAVSRISWEDLLDRAEPVSCWRIRLHTPTAHHAVGTIRKSIIVPSPEYYFGSWIARWNMCAPFSFDPNLRDLIAERVAVSDCCGHTERITYGRRQVAIGFVGTVAFELLQPQSVPPPARAALDALVRYASFCGTGVGSLRGMGQTAVADTIT
ncbi:hypothetical protein CCAX7_35780 [Capsulimonas corticalis]|uniref:Uncharacterized protein n=2 Tax=Capsulimonas corticalis TaxID=2219043 RepID=A0A402D624_9BACT|nr:hypothetical protein CCAX7_35780 [Capsulimonas corticalis]